MFIRILYTSVQDVIKMIEQKTVTKYFCDDCGDWIDSKIEPNSYCFENAKVSIMLCGTCKEKLMKWCKE